MSMCNVKGVAYNKPATTWLFSSLSSTEPFSFFWLIVFVFCFFSGHKILSSRYSCFQQKQAAVYSGKTCPAPSR